MGIGTLRRYYAEAQADAAQADAAQATSEAVAEAEQGQAPESPTAALKPPTLGKARDKAKKPQQGALATAGNGLLEGDEAAVATYLPDAACDGGRA